MSPPDGHTASLQWQPAGAPFSKTAGETPSICQPGFTGWPGVPPTCPFDGVDMSVFVARSRKAIRYARSCDSGKVSNGGLKNVESIRVKVLEVEVKTRY